MGATNRFKSKIRRAKDLKRHGSKKEPYKTVLIVCEGEKTERLYFEELKRNLRLSSANVIVANGEGSAPINIIDFAIKYIEKTGEIDEVYCVFDRDEHSTFDASLKKIDEYRPKRDSKSKPKFNAITSTPCFEFWLLLHFCYTSKPYTKSHHKTAAEKVIVEQKKYLPSYSKGENLFNTITEKQRIAIKYAKKLGCENKAMKSHNPSTNVHELVLRLENLKKR